MNGFDFLLIGLLTVTGGAVLIVLGWRRASGATTPAAQGMSPDGTFLFRQQAVRHAHNVAGVRWMTIGAVTFVLAVTRGRDTMFLVEQWENILMPLTVLTVALAITSARADRAGRQAAEPCDVPQAGVDTRGTEAHAPVPGRIEALKRTFTVTRAPRGDAAFPAGQAQAAPHPAMQCPEDSFWRDWQDPRNRPSV